MYSVATGAQSRLWSISLSQGSLLGSVDLIVVLPPFLLGLLPSSVSWMTDTFTSASHLPLPTPLSVFFPRESPLLFTYIPLSPFTFCPKTHIFFSFLLLHTPPSRLFTSFFTSPLFLSPQPTHPSPLHQQSHHPSVEAERVKVNVTPQTPSQPVSRVCVKAPLSSFHLQSIHTST